MPLQDLPPEVLVRIFASAGSRPDLRAMASTSRRIYSVFLDERAALIYQALSTELGPVLSDALAFSNTEPLDASSPSYHQQVQDSVSIYNAYLTGQNDPSPRQVSLDHALGLVNSYQTMTYLTSVYTTSKLMLFQKEIKPFSSSTFLVAPPSRTEHLRILRSFYRLQIIFNLCGSCAPGLRRKYNKPDTECINYRLFELWEPWELQQVLCVAAFTSRLHRHLTQIEDGDLREEGISRRVFFGLGALRGFIGKLRAADEATWQKVLQDTSSLRSEPRTMGTFAQYGTDCFHYRYHDYRMQKFPPGRYSFPVGVPFHGDHVTSAPLAWVDAHDGRYTHDFFAGQERARRGRLEMEHLGKRMGLVWDLLGFVMWDAPRVTALKTSSILSEFATGWALG